MTAVITQKEIEKVLNIKNVMNAVEKAFKAYGNNEVQLPSKSYLTFKEGDLRSMPCYIKTSSMDIAGIKSVNVHPKNRKYNLPTVMATILLTDPKTGYNIAVLDGTLITALRTGAAGGIAAKYLSKKNSKVAGFVGSGVQSYTQLDALMQVRKLKTVKIHSRNEKKMKAFCDYAKKKHNLKAIPCQTIQEAVSECDIVTTVTPVNKPIVKKDWIAKGTHINAIGADAAGKQEHETALTKSCKVVIDDWAQASHSGEINMPIKQGKFSRKDVYTELGNIVAGKKKGRLNEKEITMFDSTGLAIQDVSSAFLAYKLIKNKKEVKFF